MNIRRAIRSLNASLLGLFAVILSACSINPAEIINNSLSENHYNVQTVAYGKLPRQRMDIYRPNVDQGKTPIVFVYGGAWRTGTKTDYKFIGHALTQLGHPVIIPDYQLFPAVSFPVFVDDVAKAIKAAELDAPTLLGRPLDEFVLMGHSAGAHSAALLYTDKRYLSQQRVRGRVAGFIGLAGPYDLILENPEVKDVFADAKSRSQPIDFITAGLAPALLVHGEADTRVLPYHTTTFAQALAAKGNYVETQMYNGVNHVMIVGAIAQPLRRQNKSFQDIADFLSRLPNAGFMLL
ncbi:alpha/beta hydrolase [Leucothrix sargassi]|nr:alpha/beta hydrolase [Leucothrix sargassi]